MKTAEGPRDAWVASYRDPYLIVRYWIDVHDRHILRWKSLQRRSGIIYRMVPLAGGS